MWGGVPQGGVWGVLEVTSAFSLFSIWYKSMETSVWEYFSHLLKDGRLFWAKQRLLKTLVIFTEWRWKVCRFILIPERWDCAGRSPKGGERRWGASRWCARVTHYRKILVAARLSLRHSLQDIEHLICFVHFSGHKLQNRSSQTHWLSTHTQLYSGSQ